MIREAELRATPRAATRFRVAGPVRPALWRRDIDEALGSSPLREQLQPYLATLAHAAVEHGAPVLRPLRYHFPDNPATYALDDQAMLGAWLMAAPDAPRAVYLPAGRWYDWWTGAPLDGPAHVRPPAQPGRPPLYARAGAIIPCRPGRGQPLRVEIFPGDGALTLCDDPAGADGETCFRLRTAAGRLRLHVGARAGRQPIDLRVHGVAPAAAHDLPGAHYDAGRGALALQIGADGPACQLAFALEQA